MKTHCCVKNIYENTKGVIFEPEKQRGCYTREAPVCTMLVKRNATLIHEFIVSSLEEVDQL